MVGSDKERLKGRVGSGSDNARGSTILSLDEFRQVWMSLDEFEGV